MVCARVPSKEQLKAQTEETIRKYGNTEVEYHGADGISRRVGTRLCMSQLQEVHGYTLRKDG